METENKNIIGYIVETDPCKEYGMPNHENRYLFQSKNTAYRYILKLVDKVKAEYRRILDYNRNELIEDESELLDADDYSYSIGTVVRAVLGFEDVCITLNRKSEADLSSVIPDFIDSVDPSMCKSEDPQYFSEPVRVVRIKVIPICLKPEEEIIQDLKITATADDAANFIRKNSAIVVKQPGQPFIEFTYASNTEEEYDPE